jgi:hypothetical protein
MDEKTIIRLSRVIGFSLLSFSGFLMIIKKILNNNYFIIREILFCLGFLILAFRYYLMDYYLKIDVSKIYFGHLLLFINNAHALFFSDYTVIKIPDNFNFFNFCGTIANFFFIKKNPYMFFGNIFFILYFGTFMFYTYKMENFIHILQFFGSLCALISFIMVLKYYYIIYKNTGQSELIQ